MMYQGGGDELAGHLAVIDGKFYPLESYSCDIENEYAQVGDPLSTNQKTVQTETSVSGTLETYRKIEMPAHIGTPEMHDVYLFSSDTGTSERVFLEDVFFEPQLPSTNDRTQRVDFMASGIEYD